MRWHPWTTLTLAFVLACGDDTGPADVGSNDAKAADSSVARDAGDAGASDGANASDAATGPVIEVHVRTNDAIYSHADGWSGQTSRDAYQGIRRVELLRQGSDPNPLVLFDYGDGFVEAGYNAGDDTLVGAARITDLVDGQFTVGRSVITHSRYKVDAIMHTNGLSIPGEFDNIQVLSDRTEINGQARSQGWFRYVFRAAGMEFPLEGNNAPLPSVPTTGGFRLDLNEGEATYTFPVDITIDTSAIVSSAIVIEVNMNESFRWEDQSLPSYAPDVFDATPTSSEPVRRFGANSFSVYVE